MDNQHNGRTPDQAKRLPSLLVLNDAVVQNQVIGIVEHERCSLKIDSVFREIAAVFVFIPLEAHFERAVP